ncbi:MAG TPA: tetratricopeptide repeat protein [bacterium]|jgi:tetratricopeptide (TPR) repeat protein|nr:tetratricopeptide repeat protein [bacterium]
MANAAARKTAPKCGDDAAVIRRQLVWIVGVLVVAVLGYGVWLWGQDNGWGNPDRAVTHHLELGEAAFVAGRLDDAVAQYKRVVDKYPQNPQAVQARTQLATAYQQEGHLSDALAVLQGLVALLQGPADKPDLHAYTLLQIGQVKASLADYLGALDAYHSVLLGYPKTDWAGEAQSGIGQVYQDQRQFAKAREAYQKLVKDVPGGFLAAEAQTSIGACYESEANTRSALKAYQLVLDKYPSAVWDTAKARVDALKKTLESDPGKHRSRG